MKIEVHEISPADLMRLLGGETPNLDPVTRVIVLNGPPGSGKDYYCNSLEGRADVRIRRFSSPMKTIVADAAGVTWEEINTKQDKLSYLGKSLRQHQIEVFQFLEAQFGTDVLGKMLYRIIHDEVKYLYESGGGGPLPLFIVPDGGRGPEVQHIVDKFGTDNVLIVHLERDGYTFDGDIRSYVNIEGVKTVRVVNGDGDVFKADMKKIVEEWTFDWIERNKSKAESLGFGTYDLRETK